MRRLLKWLVILGVIAGLILGASIPLKAWWLKRTETQYLTATVSRGRVETVVNSTGTVKPVRSVSVGAFTSGPIAKINVDFNSVVKENDVIAEIDPMLADAAVARDRAALKAQEADLKRVEAMLKKAENDEERAKKLQAVKKDFLSESDMDMYHFARLQQEALCELGRASIDQARAALKNSETNLGYTKIVWRDKEEGIVIERKVDQGQTVAASFQTPELFTIALEMDRHMYIYASVDEADIGQIHRGEEVKFTVDAYSGELFTGQVYQVRNNSTTTQNVVTYPVVIDAPNSPWTAGSPVPATGKPPGKEAPRFKLMPGMTANISFQIESKENVLRVPVAALRFVPLPAQVRPEDRHLVVTAPTNPNEAKPKNSATDKADKAKSRQNRTVWVQEGPFLRAVPVTLGLVENQFAELVSGGLAENQAVVIGTESPLTPR